MKKQHYDNNKDKILEKQKETIKCDVCGCETTKHNLRRHRRGMRCKEQALIPNTEIALEETTS